MPNLAYVPPHENRWGRQLLRGFGRFTHTSARTTLALALFSSPPYGYTLDIFCQNHTSEGLFHEALV